MLTSLLNSTATHTNYSTSSVEPLKAKRDQVIKDAHVILGEVLSIIIDELQASTEALLNDTRATDAIKFFVKEQIEPLILRFNEMKANLNEEQEKASWTLDPKELLNIFTNLQAYLVKLMEKAQGQEDAFKVHALEQKANQILKVSEALKPLI